MRDEARQPPAVPPGLAIRRTALDPGAALPPSSPLDDERAVHFLEGEGEAEIDGRRIRVAGGDSLRLRPGTRFGVRNTQADRELAFVVATPPAPGSLPAEGPLAPLASRIAWVLRRIARRLAG